MSTHHETIHPNELKSLLASGCHLIDVREPVEHAEEHIAGAKLIPLGQLEQRHGEIGSNEPIVVMCRSGKRGTEAIRKLQAIGITDVRNLEGGILEWKGNGLPVATNRANAMPLMRQVQLTIGLGVLAGAILALTAHPNWVLLCAFFGAGLTVAGSTGWCGLAILMSKTPWNRVTAQTCSVSGNCNL